MKQWQFNGITLLIILLAFGADALSFSDLLHLAEKAHVQEGFQWIFPLLVDGLKIGLKLAMIAHKAHGADVRGWWIATVLAVLFSSALNAISVASEHPNDAADRLRPSS